MSSPDPINGSDPTAPVRPAEPTSAVAPPAHPRRIGSYTILKIIGAGGMGVVYLAEQQSPRRTVALKVIQGGAASPGALKRFEHEALVLGRLQHPGIAQIYEAGAARIDGEGSEGSGGLQPYFAMEYVRGRTLLEYTKAHELSTRDRMALFVKICQAVQHAHTKGIIHRDLKPANILVDEQGQPKILDFGVARLTDSDLQVTVRTDIGQLVGTIPYMSPEQVAADPSELDTRSDVYALGVLLYEMLAGRLPYSLERRAIHEIARIIREDEPSRLSSFNKDLRGDIETIVLKALEKEKSRRYQSASELASDITNFLHDQPIIAHPPTALYQLRKFAKRNKPLVVSAAVVLLAIIGGIVATSRQAVIATRERDRAREAERLADQRSIETERARAAEAGQQLATERALADARHARDLAERHRKLAESNEAAAKAVNTFLVDMLASADPEQAQGDQVLVKDALDAAAARVATAFPQQPAVEAAVRSVIGATYLSLGDFDAAEPHLVTAHEQLLKLYGEDHTSTIDALGELASLRDAQGRIEESERIHRQVLEACTRTQGPNHQDTLIAMANLGNFLQQDGRLDEAEPLLDEAISKARASLGEEHDCTLKFLEYQAMLIAAQGQHAEAEEIGRRVLEARRRTLGNNHPSTITAVLGLAMSLQDQGKLPEAELLYRENLEINRTVFGDSHPVVLTGLNNLAGLLYQQGKPVEAAAIYRSVLEKRQENLGADHPESLAAANNLAAMLLESDQEEEAEAVFRSNLEAQRRRLGVKHPHTLGTMSNLASVLSDRDPVAAEALYREALAIRTAEQGADNPDAIRLRYNLSQLLIDQKRYADAEQDARGAYESARRVVGEVHMMTLAAQNNYGRLLRESGRPAEAEPLYRDLLKKTAEIFPPTDQRFANYKGALGVCLRDMERHEEAEPLLLEAYTFYKTNLGDEHANTDVARQRLVLLYEAWSRPDEAAKYR